MSVSILIPVYNEQENLGKFIEKLIKKLRGIDYEVLIINDCSTDNSEKIINCLLSKYKKIKKINNKKNLGFSKSFITNISKARKKYLLLLPGDGETNLKIFNFFKKNKDKYTLCFYWKKDFRKYRKFISKLYTFLINCIFNTNYKYFNGPVFYKTKELKKIKVTSSNNFFFAEILLELSKNKKFNPKFIAVELCKPLVYKSNSFSIRSVVSVILSIYRYKLKNV